MWTIKRFPGIWLLPALLPVILMTVYPIGHALWTSLHEVMILFPAEIFEAAVLDHCSRFQTFWRVALPLALPSIGATGLFAFMLSYSEYMFAMVLSGDARTRPVSVVMSALARNTDVSWSLLNTGIFIAIVPTLILVVLVWRFVVEGLLAGSVKG